MKAAAALALALALGAAAACSTNTRDAVSEEVRISADSGVVLAGTLTRPASGARAPLVILISGSGPQDRDGARGELPGYQPFRDLAAALAAEGIAVLRTDDRGTGASSGRFAGATTLDFARDVEASLAWARTRADIDGAHTALLGHSEGALVALLVAARDTAVAGLVLLGAPSRTGRELARWQRAALVASDAAVYPAERRTALLEAAESEAERAAERDPWLRVWFALDPRTIARETRAPVLLLHGENDRQVPVEQAEELAVALRARPHSRVRARAPRRGGTATVLVQRFDGTDHLLLEDHDGDPRGYVRLARRGLRESVVEAIAAWLPGVLLSGR